MDNHYSVLTSEKRENIATLLFRTLFEELDGTDQWRN